MDLVKKSFAQFRTIGKAAIVMSGNRTSAPTTTGESAITSDVPTVTPIQYAGNTGKETTVDQTSCENAVQDLFECVQGQMHDPNSVCTEQQQAERIACTPSGNNSAVELVDSTAVQYAGDTGKEFTMNTLQIAYVEHLRNTMDYPVTTDMKVTMARRAGLMRAANSMSTAEMLMDSTFVRKTIARKIRRALNTTFVATASATDVPMATLSEYAGNTGKETVMTDERSFACTNPSIAQDYLTCKGEMTFTEAYGLCGELLDEAYINGCCETFADDCQRHERAFQQDAERYAEEMCDRCLAAYPWDEDAASGSCSQECGGGEDLGLGIDDDNYVGYLHEDGTVTRIPDGLSFEVTGFHN